jgi:hypothetical protein
MNYSEFCRGNELSNDCNKRKPKGIVREWYSCTASVHHTDQYCATQAIVYYSIG